jgi:hypothetical protein
MDDKLGILLADPGKLTKQIQVQETHTDTPKAAMDRLAGRLDEQRGMKGVQLWRRMLRWIQYGVKSSGTGSWK